MSFVKGLAVSILFSAALTAAYYGVVAVADIIAEKAEAKKEEKNNRFNDAIEVKFEVL